jgi:hypothetical protein
VECTWHTFSTQIEDQDQAQDEVEVKVLEIIGDHLVEKKDLSK